MYTRDRRDTTEKKIIKSKKNYYRNLKGEDVLLKKAQKNTLTECQGYKKRINSKKRIYIFVMYKL
jgi:hypothetical protein